MNVRKVVDLIFFNKCELYHLALRNSKSITYYLGFIFFTSFGKYAKRKSGKMWVLFDYLSGNSQGTLIHVLGMNPDFSRLHFAQTCMRSCFETQSSWHCDVYFLYLQLTLPLIGRSQKKSKKRMRI